MVLADDLANDSEDDLAEDNAHDGGDDAEGGIEESPCAARDRQILKARLPTPLPPTAVSPAEQLRILEQQTPFMHVKDQAKAKIRSFRKVRRALARRQRLLAEARRLAAREAAAQERASAREAAAKVQAAAKELAAQTKAAAKAAAKEAAAKAQELKQAASQTQAAAKQAAAEAKAVAKETAAQFKATRGSSGSSAAAKVNAAAKAVATDHDAKSSSSGLKRIAGGEIVLDASIRRIDVKSAIQLLTGLAEESKLELARLPAVLFPQVASAGKFNYSLRAPGGASHCGVQLRNRCFRSERGDWPHPVRCISWSGRDPADAWAEFKSKAKWPEVAVAD